MDLPKQDYYLPENDHLANIEISQTVIISERNLKYLNAVTEFSEESNSLIYDDGYEWYPYVNSYYPYTEDVDGLGRVNHLLECQPSTVDSFYSSEIITKKNFPYSERDAQNQYLLSTPLSFLILGKPEIGERKLAKKIAEYWNCVYIEAEIMIQEEIKSGSKVGQCIEFNLRYGRAIGINVILKLMEKRIKSESARHRGVIICGLPLIPNALYEEDPVSTMSAILNVRELFSETVNAAVDKAEQLVSAQVSFTARSEDEWSESDEEALESDREHVRGTAQPIKHDLIKELTDFPVDIGDDIDICFLSDISINYEDQLNFLFSLLTQPYLIIYMMCGTEDVIDKRNDCKFSIYSKCELQTKEDYRYDIVSYVDRRYLLSPPRNFPANVYSQLDNYHNTALRYVERRILQHDPQYFIKVDARNNSEELFLVVKKKLLILPHNKVTLPGRLHRLEMHLDVGEDRSETDLIGKIDYDQYYKFFRTQGTPGQFYWTWSDWGTMCPVSLKEGILKRGDIDFTVHFMNKLFFLANEEALLKFYRNPRSYLLQPYPRPLCKIFIFGPKASGKTTVAKCLSYLFESEILSMNEICKYIMEQKEGEEREKLRKAAVKEAIELLTKMRAEDAEEREQERIKQIKDWVEYISSEIELLIMLLDEMEKEQGAKKFEISSFPMAMEKKSGVEMETETTIAIRKKRDLLESLKIPFSRNAKVLAQYLMDKKKLLQYLPGPLRKKFQPTPVDSNDEFVLNYVKNAVEKGNIDLGISSKSLGEVLIAAIRDAESNYARKGYGRGGWIVDDMLCDERILEEMFPEYIADELILLNDTSPDFEYLVNRFSNYDRETFKDFHQVFLNMGKTNVACPMNNESSTESSKTRMVQEIVSEILGNDDIYISDSNGSNRTEHFRNQAVKFFDKWKSVKDFFTKNGKDIIEVDVSNKAFPQILEEVISKIENKYRVCARKFTQEDKAEEMRRYLSNRTSQPSDELMEDQQPTENIDSNRYYGDAYYYCPVTYHENWVLWKGKENFAAKFGNKVYLLSSEIDLNRFLQNPRYFISGKIPQQFPPPRICVIGFPGSGKTQLCQDVAKNYGLLYISFLQLVKNEYHLGPYKSFFEMRQNLKINQIVHHYLHIGEPLPETFYKGQLSNLWARKPVKEFGFILDDFPKRYSDILMMVKYKLIPDIVIVLTANENSLKASMIECLFNSWYQRKLSSRYKKIDQRQLVELEEKRQTRFQELLNERREQRFSQKQQSKETKDANSSRPDGVDSEFKSTSQISFNSVEEEKDIEEINKILDTEIPEILMEDSSETPEEAKLRLETQVNEMFEYEGRAIEAVRAECLRNNIVVETVSVDLDFYERTLRKILVITDSIKNRNHSFFERCYDVQNELAEQLLSEGYFFLSRFGRLCPIQYHENNNPFHMYEIALKRNEVFPVIHRNLIYFICGSESLEKFKRDPLLYVNVENIEFPLIPFLLGITGPPKCGKTVLAQRIGREFGLTVVTRGQAIRNMFSKMPLSSLPNHMEKILSQGWELSDELVMKSVESACLSGNAMVQARRVPVPDERFDYLCEYFKPASKVPAYLNIVDIAGLVKGASEGQGLGNAFLSHISACDAVFHLCRAFESEDVTHVEGDVNPVRDLDIISEELRLKDEDTLMKNLDKIEKTVLRGDKKQKAEYDTLVKVKEVLVEEKKHIRFADWDAKDIEVLNRYLFLTSKPALYLVNLSEKDYIKKKNKWLIKIKDWVDKNDPGALIIPFSGVFEHKLVEEYSDPIERKKFLEDNGTTSALDKIIIQGYKALQLEYFFTAGPDEVKAWTIQKGTKAPQAAGRIHTDFEKGFIMAEVMKFTDFKEEGSEAACKAAGKYRQQGRNYTVEDGDIIFFKFNAGAGLSAAKKK